MSRLLTALALVLALVAAGCGDAGDSSATSTTEPAAASTTTTTALTTTTSSTSSTTTTAPTTTTTTVALGSGPLEDLDGQRRSGEFWYVGPGTYTLSILPEELEVTLEEELSFILLSQAFVAFAEPGFLTFNKAPSITLAELSGFADPAVNDEEIRTEPPVIPFGDDEMVASFLEESDPFVLVDMGVDAYLGGEVSWWEFTLDPASESGGFPCAFSSSCYNVAVQPDHGNFVAAPGWVFRLWRLETGQSTIWGFLQTPDDQVTEGMELADAVLSGLALP